MAEMLLLNPRRRRKAKKATRRANPKRRAARSTTRRRRRNPLPMFGRVRRAARRVGRVRRRRNPIGMGRLTGSSIVSAIKDAAIAAGGAVAFDLLYARVAPMLPATLRPVAGRVGAGDAVKMLLTILAGRALRGPTRGLSMKLASGALTVQAHGVIKKMLPATVLAGMDDDGLGYYSPAGDITDASNIVGPAIDGYVTGSPMLDGMGEYVSGDGDVLLSGDMGDAFEREGVSAYR